MDNDMGSGENLIYLDTNATTPIDPEVIQSITESLHHHWGNASSSHVLGVQAKTAIQIARKQVADVVDAHPSDIVFTSGGTEANHTLLHMFSQTYSSNRRHSQRRDSGDLTNDPYHLPHIITSTIEHDSIKRPLEYMTHHGLASVTCVEVNPTTFSVDENDIIAAINKHTVLISMMLANNETGVLQPIKKISELLRPYCKANNRKIYLHTDAAQAIGKIPVSVKDLDVDYLTIVGHKFYGPRIGALYVRNLSADRDNVPFKPLFLGGGQEQGFRSGTENTAMIVGLGKACSLVSKNLTQYSSHMRSMRDYLEDLLLKQFTDAGVTINAKSDQTSRLPNTCNLSFIGENLRGCDVLARCKKIIAGVGAACHSEDGDEEGSAVLRASGVTVENARNAIRLSVGRYTTKKEIEDAVEDFTLAVKTLRRLSK